MKKILSVFIIILFLSFFGFLIHKNNQTNMPSKYGLKYVAIGDSYTIGEGASVDKSWPAFLTKQLKENGASIELVANPSVTGWTTQDVIDNELPIYDSSNPNFATLLIGVNDWVQGVDKDTFHQNLKTILDRMQEKLLDKHNLIIITIPDFSATPTGAGFGNGRDITRGISEFNYIIKQEAAKRNLQIVDIFGLTQQMKNDPKLIAPDGLHPSAKEYALWEKLIYPVALKILLK